MSEATLPTPATEPVVSPAPTPPAMPPAPEPAAEPVKTADPASPADAGKPKKRRRGLMIGVITIGVVIAILGGLFLFLLTPPSSAEFSDPVSAGTRSTNAALYAALVAAAIDNPFVDTNEERAYVAYTLPNASLAQADTYQRFVIGSAADASPSSEYIYAFQYVGKDPHQLWIVKMSDFLSYVAGDSTLADMEAKIQKVMF